MKNEKDLYLKSLGYWNKPDLQRLIDIFCKEKYTGFTNELSKHLVDKHFNEIQKFFDQCKKFQKEASFNSSLEFLCNEYPNRVKELEKLQNAKQIVLFLYGRGDIDKFEDLINSSRIKKAKIKNNYSLIPEEKLPISELKDKLQYFIQDWNDKNVWKLDITSRSNKEDAIKLYFYIEKGRKPLQQFIFRKENINYKSDNGLKTITDPTYPVYVKICELQTIEDGKFMLTLDFKEETWFGHFLKYMFGDYKIEEINKKFVEGFSSKVKSKLDTASNLSSASGVIEKLKEKAIKTVTDSSIPGEKKEKINEIIKTINYCSPKLKNEVRSGIDDFVWLADFDKCNKVIPHSKEVIEDILTKIPESRDRFFLVIGKKKPILIDGGVIKRRERLSDDEETSLAVFLGGEDALKNMS